jgi:hypothetical protein
MKHHPMAAALGVWLVLTAGPAAATEGGSSLYLQGAYNDFAAGMFQAPGVYFRNDIALYDASAGVRPLGGRLALDSTQRVWMNLAKLAYQAEGGPFGARYGAAMVLPVVLNAEVSATGSLGGFSAFRSGNTAGIGDLYVAPLQLNWTFGNHHVTLSPGVYAPTGRYSADRALNTGRNHWGFDLAASYTWLDPQRGHEVSFTAGYLINTRNDATGYRSGNEFHLDWLVGQHVSERFAVAATGYFYQQLTDDSSQRGAGSGGFRGSGVGIGPAVLWTPRIGSRDISLIAKWIHDTNTRNRFEGDLVMVSAAFRF